MPLNRQFLTSLQIEPLESVIRDHDLMLYALSIGLAADPLNDSELPFVYEKELKAFPTMPLVLPSASKWMSDPATGISWNKVVQGAERLTISRLVPTGRPLSTNVRVSDILDKGSKGALLLLERRIVDMESDEIIAVCESAVFCRGDGGFGGRANGGLELRALPTRMADASIEVLVPAQAALLYRLNEDRNPLHCDPEYARAAGFPRPILHGLATLGIAAVAAFRRDPTRLLAGIEARFANPVYPGELLVIDFWDEPHQSAFRVRIPHRAHIVALDQGHLRYR